ncbi:MAG: PDR/VanB family oxidoreductase [Microbacterium sp.]
MTDSDALTPGIRETLHVGAVEPIASDVVLITLAHPQGHDLPLWQPGDHIDLEFEPGLTRQYSLVSRPSDRHRWQIAVRRSEPGTGGSAYAHERLSVGDLVRVAGPKHRFPLGADSSYLLIAGGIGITPVLTMAEHLAEQGAPFRLVYVGRGSDRMPFTDRVRAVGGQIVDRAVDATTLADVLANAAADVEVYACGPHPMLDELAERVPGGRLHLEDFDPPAAPAEGADGADEAFEVQLGIDGPVLPVPASCPLLDVLLDHGLDIMWSCREGNCASCETNVLDGVPLHRDVILTDDERAAGDVMFPCVSRACSARLVLDL